jgi:hypothetical protein
MGTHAAGIGDPAGSHVSNRAPTPSSARSLHHARRPPVIVTCTLVSEFHLALIFTAYNRWRSREASRALLRRGCPGIESM